MDAFVGSITAFLKEVGDKTMLVGIVTAFDDF